MSTISSPIFWRDARMPYVELRKISDARQVCYAPHSHTHWSLGAITAGKSTFCYRDATHQISAGDIVMMNPTGCMPATPSRTSPGRT